jgi:predicted nucleic acid-binding protein
VLSAVVGKAPSLPLIRRLARTPPEQQFTTAITLGEPDLRIASIALSQGLTVVTGNVRHVGRVPGLKVENWLST